MATHPLIAPDLHLSAVSFISCVHVLPQVLAHDVGLNTFGFFMAFSSDAEYLAVSEWPDGTFEVRGLLSCIPGFSDDDF